MMIFSHDFGTESFPTDSRLKAEAFSYLLNERISKEIGYYELPFQSLALIEQIDRFAEKNPFLAAEIIQDIAVIGIGGSSLGTKGIDSLLKSKKMPKRTLHFLENTDPIAISKTLSKLNKERTLFIIISKSGTTIETVSIFKTVIGYYGLDLDGIDKDRIVAITDEGSPLSQFASYHGVKQFEIPENVGGRFSVLSAAGIVPLTLAGYDTKSLLEEGGRFLERFFNHEEDHLLDKAVFLYKQSVDIKINVVFAYADELENLCKWYVQLWAESLGKMNGSGKHIGLTPYALIGSVDQHSFLQLIIEGPRDKSVTFITIEDFENNLLIPDISLKYIEGSDFVNRKKFNELINLQCEATKESLKMNNIPTDDIIIRKINEASVGTIIVYYELLTTLMGRMMDINPYNQPGVELGKQILYKKFIE